MKCLTEKEITDYIYSNKPNSEIESHLLECDKCLNIILLAKNKEKKNIKNDTIKSPFKSYFKELTPIAASFIVLFISSIFVFQEQKVKYENKQEIEYYTEYINESNKEINNFWEENIRELES